MKCKKCQDAGFTVYETQRSGGLYAIVQQCCDVAKYAKEIKRRYMGDVPPAEPVQPVVLPFRGKRGET